MHKCMYILNIKTYTDIKQIDKNEYFYSNINPNFSTRTKKTSASRKSSATKKASRFLRESFTSIPAAFTSRFLAYYRQHQYTATRNIFYVYTSCMSVFMKNLKYVKQVGYIVVFTNL